MPRLLWSILILLLAAGLWWLQDGLDGQNGSQPALIAAPGADPALIVRNVEVRDLDGRVAWRGDVDLNPVLARIEAGERDPHRNDGAVFHNRERRLPDRPRGHYREFVVRTPRINHAGPQRLVIGADGEIFYTADHYRSFQRLR
ncbi:MAG: ribonuclease domain-containing protein [Wenzhouxiangella sp.]